MTSVLSGPSLAASRAALSAALADQSDAVDDSLEPGEIQEVDMQAQAEGIRTVFSDPTNFNVKVWFVACIAGPSPDPQSSRDLAPPLLSLDSLVRLSSYERPEFAPNTRLCLSPDTCASKHPEWRRHKAGWKISSG